MLTILLSVACALIVARLTSPLIVNAVYLCADYPDAETLAYQCVMIYYVAALVGGVWIGVNS